MGKRGEPQVWVTKVWPQVWPAKIFIVGGKRSSYNIHLAKKSSILQYIRTQKSSLKELKREILKTKYKLLHPNLQDLKHKSHERQRHLNT